MCRKLEDAFSSAVFFYNDAGTHQTNWSKSVCAGFAQQNFDEVPFRVPQLLEPSALSEVAQQHAIGVDELEFFSYEIEGPAVKLKWLIDMQKWAPPVQKLSLAQCLASSCRYRFAKKILAQIPYAALYPDQRVTYQLTHFAIHNRLEIKTSHQEEFIALKALLQEHQITPARVLDVCSQAIVWKIKGNIIDNELSQWFIATGERTAKKIATSNELDELISLSSYYRGLAMIPAAKGDITATRHYMILAENFAEAALSNKKSTNIAGREVRKTVYESKLKEMLYVAHDIESARCVAAQLLAYDPDWSISYHEAGEIEVIDRQWQRALELYQMAYNIGFPRLTFSQYMVGACHQQLGQFELALEAFKSTLLIDSTNISAGVAGYHIARQHLPEALPLFKSYLDAWRADNILPEVYRGITL